MADEHTPAPHVQRMIEEQSELDDRLHRLAAFIDTGEVYQTLSADSQNLLTAQRHAMQAYSTILGMRIRSDRVL